MIVIGDVHGELETLKALIAQFPKDQKIVFCGDLVDRGPHSNQVVQFVIDNGYDCVMGNHEDMMESEWDDGARWSGMWLPNGGHRTLDSYKGDNALIRKHVEWMAELPTILAYDQVKNADGRFLVVSHSSCGQFWNSADKETNSEWWNKEIMWNRRNPPVDAPEIFNVFGHSPRSTTPIITNYYANIDTGVCFKDMGVLTGLQFPEMIVYQQKTIY